MRPIWIFPRAIVDAPQPPSPPPPPPRTHKTWGLLLLPPQPPVSHPLIGLCFLPQPITLWFAWNSDFFHHQPLQKVCGPCNLVDALHYILTTSKRRTNRSSLTTYTVCNVRIDLNLPGWIHRSLTCPDENQVGWLVLTLQQSLKINNYVAKIVNNTDIFQKFWLILTSKLKINLCGIQILSS